MSIFKRSIKSKGFDGIRWGGFIDQHFRGITDKDEKFVFCPIGRIASWSADDYDNEWCANCKIYYHQGKE